MTGSLSDVFGIQPNQAGRCFVQCGLYSPSRRSRKKLGKEAGDLDQKDVVEFVKLEVSSKIRNRIEIKG